MLRYAAEFGELEEDIVQAMEAECYRRAVKDGRTIRRQGASAA